MCLDRRYRGCSNRSLLPVKPISYTPLHRLGSRTVPPGYVKLNLSPSPADCQYQRASLGTPGDGGTWGGGGNMGAPGVGAAAVGAAPTPPTGGAVGSHGEPQVTGVPTAGTSRLLAWPPPPVLVQGPEERRHCCSGSCRHGHGPALVRAKQFLRTPPGDGTPWHHPATHHHAKTALGTGLPAQALLQDCAHHVR